MGGSSQIMELVEENARLKAENERVLSDNKLLIVKLNAEHIVGQNVESENAKLRELVARLIACAGTINNKDTLCYHPLLDGCGFDCTVNGEHCSLAKMCDQARELGVEVDE